MKSTKLCLCGKINKADAQFCEKCGQKLINPIDSIEQYEINEKKKITAMEEEILESKYFICKVGYIHQGLSSWGVWGTLKNGSMKFKKSKIRLYDDKIIIERNKRIVEFNDIKEIFMERVEEAIIVTNNGDNVVLKSGFDKYKMIAFKNVLNKLIEENKSNTDDISTNDNDMKTPDDGLDKLLELGKMYEKGLLTDEEFALMKKKFINKTAEDTLNSSDNDINSSNNVCESCGAKISPNDAFCSECGNKIH